MRGVEPGFQEVGIARVSADIFWRARPFAGDAAGVSDFVLSFGTTQYQLVLPVIAKVVFIGDGKLRIDLIGNVRSLS